MSLFQDNAHFRTQKQIELLCILMSMKMDERLLHSTSMVLRRLRIEHKFSQEELAALAGISRSMVDKIERRQRLPSLEILIKIARAIDLKASVILEMIEEELGV